MNGGMGTSDVRSIIEKAEQLLAEEALSEKTELAIQELLNVVEALSADKKILADEAERLRKQLDQKKKSKNASNRKKDDLDTRGDDGSANSDHSSEKRRKAKKKPKANDRRSFKGLTIHDTVECPVDPGTLPSDAVRLQDEIVVVQDIEIKPKNTQFQRQVFYSASQQTYYRGPLPAGYDHGDFSASQRALTVSLKYCGSMSEPKIGEFLENFDVQVSSGSLSNILTKPANLFQQDYDELLIAGLSSTPYQQTDDTSARVHGEFWNTHVLCNPFYTFYSTRASSSCSRTNCRCVGFMPAGTTRSFRRPLTVTHSLWTAFWTVTGPITHRCKTIARVRRRSWQKSCDWSSTSCFRLGRSMRHSTIESRKRRRRKTSC